jgi:hypothetical protein
VIAFRIKSIQFMFAIVTIMVVTAMLNIGVFEWPDKWGGTHRAHLIHLRASNVNGGRVRVDFTVYSTRRGKIDGTSVRRGEWFDNPFDRDYFLIPGETVEVKLMAGIVHEDRTDVISCSVVADGKVIASDHHVKRDDTELPDINCRTTLIGIG